jgi:hypothetical protein
MYWLVLRIREQARSHRGYALADATALFFF